MNTRPTPRPRDMRQLASIIARTQALAAAYDWTGIDMPDPAADLNLIARDLGEMADEVATDLRRGRLELEALRRELAGEKRAYERERELAEERRMVGAA